MFGSGRQREGESASCVEGDQVREEREALARRDSLAYLSLHLVFHAKLPLYPLPFTLSSETTTYFTILPPFGQPTPSLSQAKQDLPLKKNEKEKHSIMAQDTQPCCSFSKTSFLTIKLYPLTRGQWASKNPK